jgi:tetratricopeptide (TPR) repeat protein
MSLGTVTTRLALIAAVVAAGCAAHAPAQGDPSALAATSLVAADAPKARDCLPPPAPLDLAGDDPDQQALRHYMRGRLLMSQQDTVTAAKELRQAAHLAPDVPRIWLNLGLAQYDAGKVSAAVEALDKALDLAPKDEPSLYFRGRIAAARGDLVQAADLFNRLLEAAEEGTPFQMLGTYHLARVQHNLGNLAAAAVAYEKLLDAVAEPQAFFRRYPELYLIYRSKVKLRTRLAQLLLAQERPDRAVTVLEEALQERPRNADLLELMARAHFLQKDFDAVRQWAERLIEVQPDGAAGYRFLVDAYKAEGRPQAVIPALERHYQARADNQSLGLLLASAYESAGRQQDAARLYRDLCRPDAKVGADPSAALKLADIHLEADRPVEALQALAATMVTEVLHSSVLVKAAKIIDGLDRPADVYRQARRLVEGDVPHYGPFVLVGMLAEAADRPADALSLYDKALSRQPKAALAYSRKADLLIRDRRLQDALSVYRSAVRAGLDLPVFHRKMGMILEELDRLDEAIEAYRAARDEAPRDRPTSYFLASALAKQDRFDEAVDTLKRLLTHHPKDLRALVQLAGLYLGRGDLDAAEDVLLRARDLHPDATGPVAVLAEVRYRQERYDDTIALVRRLLAADPDRQSMRILMAYAMAGNGDLEAAAKEVKALLAADPENVEWRYVLAGFYTEMGDQQAAERELLRILDTRPDHAPSNNDLGYLWADRGRNLGRAERMIRTALEAEPEHPAYLDSLGWVLYKQGRFKDAVGALERAIRLAPELDPVLWDHLGDSYWRLDRREKAGEAWKQAADILQRSDKPDRDDDLRRVRKKLDRLQEGGRPDVAPVAEEPPAGGARSDAQP